MGSNNYFQFKQFRVEQEQSAMKVGIDGVLLGAWANVDGCSQILDVGTGTGLIALMLAQRSEAKITAIEIEKKAALEAAENVSVSPWNERIEVVHTSFQDFAKKCHEKFDLIVSNPPYFSNSFKAANSERTLARHNDTLPFSVLIKLASEMLSEHGRLALIVPGGAIQHLKDLAELNHLFLQHITAIKPKPGKSVNRALLEWGRKQTALKEDCLIIYNRDNSFTEEYIGLTKEFYLKF